MQGINVKLSKKSSIFVYVVLLLIALTITIFLVFNERYGSSEILSSDVAEHIAKDYFFEEYGLDVEFINVYHLQVGEHTYRNSIKVAYKDDEYCLYLSKNNRPCFDDFRETVRKKELETMDLQAVLELSGIVVKEVSFAIGCSYDQQKCVLILESVTDQLLPSYTHEMYSFISELNALGIDGFNIVCKVPDFMQPRFELGYGMYSINLGAYTFDTRVSEKKFKKAYCEFQESVFYDEQKFNSIVLEMERLGYRNVCFMIPSQTNATLLEIILYCEANENASLEQVQHIIDGIDETYFKCQGREIKYLLSYNRAE